MREWQSYERTYRGGVRVARGVARLSGRKRARAHSRPVVVPFGAHVETFAEAVRWGQPFLSWGKIWRWLKGGAK